MRRTIAGLAAGLAALSIAAPAAADTVTIPNVCLWSASNTWEQESLTFTGAASPDRAAAGALRHARRPQHPLRDRSGGGRAGLQRPDPEGRRQRLRLPGVDRGPRRQHRGGRADARGRGHGAHHDHRRCGRRVHLGDAAGHPERAGRHDVDRRLGLPDDVHAGGGRRAAAGSGRCRRRDGHRPGAARSSSPRSGRCACRSTASRGRGRPTAAVPCRLRVRRSRRSSPRTRRPAWSSSRPPRSRRSPCARPSCATARAGSRSSCAARRRPAAASSPSRRPRRSRWASGACSSPSRAR